MQPTRKNTKILEMNQVCHYYDLKHHEPALEVDSFSLAAGEIVGLVGPNGSGKSTFLKILACVKSCTSGAVRFCGEPVAPFSHRVRGRLALLPQEPYLLRRSVFENIAYGPRRSGHTGELAARVIDALAAVGLPASFAGRKWSELSGGEAQRVALAARLVLRPECLLLDEPTASVDMQSAVLIRQAIRAARNDWGTTLVIASHQRAWLSNICDRLVFLHNGRIIQGDTENIVFGPWRRVDAARSEKTLLDGQKIVVGVTPSVQASCLVAPEKIRLMAAGQRLSGEENVLRGTVTGIFLEQGSGAMTALVCCGGQSLTVRRTVDHGELTKYAPGEEVTVTFAPGAVMWLS